MTPTKILIVEDDGTIIVRLERLLQTWGYETLTAGSGEIALQLAEKDHPDLALMDIRLGDGVNEMDGIETAQELRCRFDMPAIYLSAYADEEFLQRARQTEPYGYLVKPLQELSLWSTLAMATAKLHVDHQLKAALHEKDVLMREILHRTKNNMLAINGLLSLQSDYAKDARIQSMLQDLQNRIYSMSIVQEKLYRSQALTHIALHEYLMDLAYMIVSNYSLSSDAITLRFEMAPLIVSADTAIPCGLILNELLSNALKYAFPGNRKGEIFIGLRSLGENEGELRICDHGVGIPADLDIENTESLGLQLVRNFTAQLQGTFILKREQGTDWRIHFELV